MIRGRKDVLSLHLRNEKGEFYGDHLGGVSVRCEITTSTSPLKLKKAVSHHQNGPSQVAMELPTINSSFSLVEFA